MNVGRTRADSRSTSGAKIANRGWRLLALVVGLALTARLVAGALATVTSEEPASRVDFLDIAANLVAGHGFRSGGFVRDGVQHFRYGAYRPPFYPLLLAATSLEASGVLRIVLQAGIGAGTAVCAFLLARLLFGDRAGVLAGLGVALYPYYVWHDTAIQETGLYTFLVALGILALVKIRHSEFEGVLTTSLIGAAVALGLGLLTRATLAPFLPLAVLGIALFGGTRRPQRVWRALVFAGTLALVISPWLVRNAILIGSPVITSQTGRLLWVAQNPDTFASYPTGSIDVSRDVAFAALGPAELASLEHASATEMDESRWYEQRAVEFMVAHPGEVAARGFEKVVTGFSWIFSPRKPLLEQTVYFLSYAPVLFLGIAGGVLARRSWRDHLVIYFLFLAFLIVTAVFWAHTAHRTFLDVYLIVFASHAVSRLWDRATSGVTSPAT